MCHGAVSGVSFVGRVCDVGDVDIVVAAVVVGSDTVTWLLLSVRQSSQRLMCLLISCSVHTCSL